MNAQINNVTVELLCKNVIKVKEDDWDCLFMGNMLCDCFEQELYLSEWLHTRCFNGRSIYIGDPGRDILKIFEFEYLELLETYDLPETGLHAHFNKTNVYKLNCII